MSPQYRRLYDPFFAMIVAIRFFTLALPLEVDDSPALIDQKLDCGCIQVNLDIFGAYPLYRPKLPCI
jgi:hypothetical protein